MTVIKVPTEEAARLIEQRGWTQGEYEREGDGVCAHGAIRLCCPVPGDAQIIEQVAKRRGRGTDWNDNEACTVDDVLASLRTEKWDVTDADLAKTFGPQWEAVVALVRRAAQLTEQETDPLAATRGAVRDAARGAVRGAARDAAWAAAWAAVRAAVRAAAWAAAWDAAWAATALVVRDLIGQHGFTQEHYDTLTRPWRTAIGPVHPDDAEVTR